MLEFLLNGKRLDFKEMIQRQILEEWVRVSCLIMIGLLGLDDLHYFAKYHPEEAQNVLKTSHAQSWFSMAIVGINMTAYALQLVRTRQLQLFFYTNGTAKEIYHEFYCKYSSC